MDIITDFSSDISGLKKKVWRKEIIICIIFAILLISLILIVIVASVSSSNNEKNKNKEKIELGIINCLYDIQSSTSEIQIIGEQCKNDFDLDIFIEGEKIKYTKKYKFKQSKIYEIQFKLYDDINMDYMFQNISSLVSLEMKSDNNLKIKSMISTFENCKNLEFFSIKKKSMEKRNYYMYYLCNFNY